MGVEISPYHVRRATWIDATPDEVWAEFTSLERMQAWYGTGHTLAAYEPRVGGVVETVVDIDGEPNVFRGTVVAFEPGVELSFAQQWIGSTDEGPSTVTFRLRGHDRGTVVELIHHGYEGMGGHPSEHLDGYESGWTTRQIHALRDVVAA